MNELLDKVREYVRFASSQSTELVECYAAIPDSLGRRLLERIELLKQRADSEAELAVKLRNRLEEIKPGSSSDI